MKIGDASTPDELSPRNWERFAEITELGSGFVRRRVTALAEAIQKRASEVSRTIGDGKFDNRELMRFAAIVHERAGIVGASV